MKTLSFDDITPEQLKVVDENWAVVNKDLDNAIALLKEHKATSECAHPACSGPQFNEDLGNLADRDPVRLTALAHIAILRLVELELEGK